MLFSFASSEKPQGLSREFLRHFPSRLLNGEYVPLLQTPSKLDVNLSSIVARELQRDTLSVREMAKYLGVNRGVIHRLVMSFREKKQFSMGSGRRPKIGKSNQKLVVESVALANQKKNARTQEEFKDLLIKSSVDTDIARGGNGLHANTMSKTTQWRYMQKLGIHEEKGQKTTPARREAALDIRNFITMAAMNEVCGKGLSWHCIGNMDATSFLLKFSNDQKLVSVEKHKEPTTRTEECPLALFVKQYFLVSASGFLARPLFVMADDSMDPTKYDLLKVPGLSFSMDSPGFGYIVFCHSRAGNPSFHHWLFHDYLVKFARMEQEAAKIKKFYLVIDGEATQLGALEDPTVLSTLTAEGIDVGKGPASCSGVCGNALDCGNMFKAVKATLKGKEAVGKGECPNSELLEEISTMIKTRRPKLSADKVKKMCNGIVHVLYRERNILNQDMVKNGFKKIGMIGKDMMDTTLRCCPNSKVMSKKELDNICKQFPTLVEYFSTRGEITEAEMDTLKIPKANECYIEEEESKETPKDQRVLHRRRAVFLTKDAHVESRKKAQEQNILEEAQKELAKEEKANNKRKKEEEKAENEEIRKKAKLEKEAAKAAALQIKKLRTKKKCKGVIQRMTQGKK